MFHAGTEGRAWFELTLECGRAGLDTVCEHLETAGAMTVTLEDAGDDPQIEPGPGATPLWPHVRVRALYGHPIDAEAVRLVLPGGPVVTNVRVREIADRDWIAASREDVVPMEIGSLWIGPQWAIPPPNRTVVRLEPGLAFGSGRHPTTRLCLERLAAAPPAGIDVIDYGCGSGILAVTAAALGARQVLALDIDPQALRATSENARSNGVADRVSAIAAEAAERMTVEPASLVVANILAGPLVELAPHLSALTTPGGELTLSGILEAQAGEVADAYRGAFDMQVAGESEGWVRLDGRRRHRARPAVRAAGRALSRALVIGHEYRRAPISEERDTSAIGIARRPPNDERTDTHPWSANREPRPPRRPSERGRLRSGRR